VTAQLLVEGGLRRGVGLGHEVGRGVAWRWSCSVLVNVVVAGSADRCGVRIAGRSMTTSARRRPALRSFAQTLAACLGGDARWDAFLAAVAGARVEDGQGVVFQRG